MALWIENGRLNQDEAVRRVDRPDVCVDVLTRGDVWQALSVSDDECLSFMAGCSPRDERDALSGACTLNLRTGILDVPIDAAARVRIIRAGGGLEVLSRPGALLADGDAVWLLSANHPACAQSMLGALDAQPHAGFQAIASAASLCGETAFAAVRAALPGEYQSTRVPSELPQGERVADYVSEKIEAADCPPKLAIAFITCIDELFSNIVFYSGSPDIEVGCSIARGYVSVRLTDTGKPFDPNNVKQPDITLSAEERKIGGLGVFMVKKLMDSFEYEYRAGQNITIIRKRIPV